MATGSEVAAAAAAAAAAGALGLEAAIAQRRGRERQHRCPEQRSREPVHPDGAAADLRLDALLARLRALAQDAAA